MKRAVLILLFLLLAGCAAAPTVDQRLPTDDGRVTLTSSPRVAALSPTSTVSATLLPSLTPVTPSATLRATNTLRPTATQTQLPTATRLPSITPTFDAASVVTRTSAPPAVCPVEKPELVPDLDYDVSSMVEVQKLYSQILDFLNIGGTRQAIITAYRQHNVWADDRIIREEDVTADGIPELLLAENDSLVAYVCENGHYLQKWLPAETYHYLPPEIVAIADMNLDGVDEIITISGDDRIRIVSVLEWNGDGFKRLNPDRVSETYQPCSILYGSSWPYAIDIDSNGTLELVLKQAIPIWSEYTDGLPWRKENRTCTWNGELFLFTFIEYAPPEYRFQAIQDGDRASLAGNYEKALDFYQQTVFSDKLDWWSLERRFYEVQISLPALSETPTPPATLAPDPLEYPNLAAYARFRIMLLHLLRGYLPEAKTVYDTLQEKFPAGQPGHAYAEMAAAFWDEYQASQSMSLACAKAVEYAAAHPVEILAYLGNGDYAIAYFGEQSLDYQPEDVCPFR